MSLPEQKTTNREERAAQIRAELAQIETQIGDMQRASLDTLERTRVELQQASHRLAETQMDLAFRRAWRGEGQ